MHSSSCFLILVLAAAVGAPYMKLVGAGSEFQTLGPQHAKLSGIIIPGFASTQLRAWAMLDCPFSPMDIYPLDSVWLDTRKVVSVTNCWLKCILLDPLNQTDHPECKSRPDTGLSAITELDPGYITGPLSSVWRDWVHWFVEFGIDANSIIAAPYDWRLPGAMLEERDLYFHKLKLTFETTLKLVGGPSLVFAHSMGNNVFRYFLEWLKLEIAPKLYHQWIDDHIYAYVAVGAPLLGTAEAVKATMSGITFGLPIPEGTTRLMCNSFGSSLWMLPFSKNCHANHLVCKKLIDGSEDKVAVLCDKNEYTSDFSGWPVDIVKIDIPPSHGIIYTEFSNEAEEASRVPECSIPMQRSFSAKKVSDGTLFREIEHLDPYSKIAALHLEKFYLNDSILNALTPWERPPIKNIFCVYGINLKTEVGYHFAPSGKPYPDNWMITEIIFETDGGYLQSRSGAASNGNSGPASGDSTIPYHSLSFCKTWLGSKVNVTRTRQSAHNGSDVQEIFNLEHNHGDDIIPNMTRDNRIKYITYYEDGNSIPGKRTAVWEIDKVNHRNIVRSPVFMRELWLELMHSLHPDAKRKFVSKAIRDPIRDEDCYWDYTKARCGLPDYCEYRYVFGDVHLGQSCRLKNPRTKDLLHKLI